jgi:hypothetical protein
MACYILQEMNMNDVVYEQVNGKQERKMTVGTWSLHFWKTQVSESMVSGKSSSF